MHDSVLNARYSPVCNNIRDRSKIEIPRTRLYNYIDKNVDYVTSPETSTCEVPIMAYIVAVTGKLTASVMVKPQLRLGRVTDNP